MTEMTPEQIMLGMLRGHVNLEQYDALHGKKLRDSRVATRKQGGRDLSYLESWDIRVHLIRVFGYGGFDIEVLEQHHVADREYMSSPQQGDPKPMVEVVWFAKVRLILRDPQGREIARYTEGAVGNATGSASGPVGDHHDNAAKTAASDALKRCAINLGTLFGLSLYDGGNKNDVVKMTLVTPEGYEPPEEPPQQAKDAVAASTGATERGETQEAAE